MYSSRDDLRLKRAPSCAHREIRWCDSVEPGGERRVAAEVADRAVDAQERLLGDVAGVVVIVCEPVGEVIDLLLVPPDEFVESGQVASPAALNDRFFFRRQTAAFPRIYSMVVSISDAASGVNKRAGPKHGVRI